MTSHSSEATQLLARLSAGDEDAGKELLPFVYDELRRVASSCMRTERDSHTLQPTALVHEAWVKLVGHIDSIEDRTHFFAVASQAMRQVLIDHARGKSRLKRGNGFRQVTLSGIGLEAQGAVDLVDLNDSLSQLSTLNERHAQVVELRILGGLTVNEVADFLGVAHATIERDWLMAKAWLRVELAPPQ